MHLTCYNYDSYNKINVDSWYSFVNNHSNGNFFQTPYAFELFNSVKNYKPILITAEKGKKIEGILLAILMREPGLKSYLTRRCIIWGGPLVRNNDREIMESLLVELNNKLNSYAIYTEFRNLYDNSSFRESFEKFGWCYEDHLNILVNLELSEEQLWKEVHPKRRNKIRKAIKEGTKFDVLTEKEKLIDTYRILEEVYSRARLPLPNFYFFYSAYELLSPDILKVFIATYKGKIIGTRYTICYKGIIYDWYAGSYQKYYDKHPNDLIPWNVFLWGKQHGFHTFDFGGAGKPNVPYGVRDYKMKFGGTIVNYGRFKKINSHFLYNVGKLGLSILSKIKK